MQTKMREREKNDMKGKKEEKGKNVMNKEIKREIKKWRKKKEKGSVVLSIFFFSVVISTHVGG